MITESQENFGEVKQVFKTEEFEGPLDLLLYQIQKAEINIYNIPICEITEQFIEYINIHKVIPNFALVIAEDTFQQLNVAPNLADHVYYDINKPVENYWWTKLVSNTTGTFNPEGREDLCPMKDFINKRR